MHFALGAGLGEPAPLAAGEMTAEGFREALRQTSPVRPSEVWRRLVGRSAAKPSIRRCSFQCGLASGSERQWAGVGRMPSANLANHANPRGEWWMFSSVQIAERAAELANLYGESSFDSEDKDFSKRIGMVLLKLPLPGGNRPRCWHEK